MSHPIWYIGLFKKVDQSTAECLDCKKGDRQNYTFKLANSSTQSLSVHLRSKFHKDSEYAKKFDELIEKKKIVKMLENLD